METVEAVSSEMIGHIAGAADIVDQDKLMGFQIELFEGGLESGPNAPITAAAAPGGKKAGIEVSHV